MEILVTPHKKETIISHVMYQQVAAQSVDNQVFEIKRQKWEAETKSKLIIMLRGWVNQRNKALIMTKALSGKRAAAVDKILLMLERHENSRLHILCRRIVQDGQYFIELLPSKDSSHYPYFKRRIAPALIWADNYRQEFDNANHLGIKTV